MTTALTIIARSLTAVARRSGFFATADAAVVAAQLFSVPEGAYGAFHIHRWYSSGEYYLRLTRNARAVVTLAWRDWTPEGETPANWRVAALWPPAEAEATYQAEKAARRRGEARYEEARRAFITRLREVVPNRGRAIMALTLLETEGDYEPPTPMGWGYRPGQEGGYYYPLAHPGRAWEVGSCISARGALEGV